MNDGSKPNTLSVKGKTKIMIFVDDSVEQERRRFVEDTYGPGARVLSAVYQAAIMEYLRNRGYCLQLPSRREHGREEDDK